MKNWESEFASHILERGFNYFEEGAVTELTQTPEGYEATVEGTVDYHVEIGIYDQKLMAMSCDCPYAEGGKNCKHIAAVLYAIEECSNETYSLHDPAVANSSVRALEKLIGQIPKDDLRHFLCEYAARDDALRNALIARYASLQQPRTMSMLKREVELIATQYADRSGFIDYRHAWQYEAAMIDILNDRVSPLIDRGEYTQAFELSAYLYLQTTLIEIDDSDGTLCNILGTCCDCWAHILANCNDREKESIYLWFESHIENGVPYFAEEIISDFIMEHFDSHNLLLKKLKLIDEQIQQLERKPDEFSNYKFSQLLLDRLQIMKALEYPADEIDAYTKHHYDLPGIRQYLIHCAVDENRIDDAVSLLLESKEIDANTGYVARYREQLISLYKMQGNQSAYLKELREYVLRVHQYSLEYIFKLKNAVSEDDWDAIREELLASKSCEPIRLKLLETEQLYARLLHAVLESDSSYTLAEYEKTLRPLYPTELLQEWKAQIDRLSKQASNRKNYYTLMKLLLKLRKYPGGQAAAEQFAREWRVIYKRRPAMLDELAKAGF